MSGALRTLLDGGKKIFLKPPYCARRMRSRDAPQEGIDSAPSIDSGQALPEIPYWSDPPPLDEVGQTYPDPCTELPSSSAHSNVKGPGRRANFIKPDISISRLQAADSIISIVFGMKRLAWAHVDRTLTVRDCEQHEWVRLKGTPHSDQYLDNVSSAVSKFPVADIYILEKSLLSTSKATMFPVTLHLRIVEAMLYALLNPGYCAEHRVFSMSRTMVGKHFNIMVGGAKTSGVDLVQQLVEEANTRERPRIHFTPDLLLKYKHKLLPRGQNRNEEMCDALLQALAFYEFTKKYDM